MGKTNRIRQSLEMISSTLDYKQYRNFLHIIYIEHAFADFYRYISQHYTCISHRWSFLGGQRGLLPHRNNNSETPFIVVIFLNINLVGVCLSNIIMTFFLVHHIYETFFVISFKENS